MYSGPSVKQAKKRESNEKHMAIKQSTYVSGYENCFFSFYKLAFTVCDFILYTDTKGILLVYSSSDFNLSHTAINFLFGDIAKHIILSKFSLNRKKAISFLSWGFIPMYLPTGYNKL